MLVDDQLDCLSSRCVRFPYGRIWCPVHILQSNVKLNFYVDFRDSATKFIFIVLRNNCGKIFVV